MVAVSQVNGAMREFGYTGIAGAGVLLRQLAGVVSIIMGTSVAVLMVVLSISQFGLYHGAIWTFVCTAVWALLAGWIVGFVLINFHPTVYVGDDGLAISYFGRRIRIPWDDIVDVGAGFVPIRHTLVRARRITPWHRLYGWLYSFSLLPAFVIGRDIENYDELLHEIRRRVGAGRMRQ